MIKRIFVTKNFGLRVEGRVHELKVIQNECITSHLHAFEKPFCGKKSTTAVKQKNPSKQKVAGGGRGF